MTQDAQELFKRILEKKRGIIHFKLDDSRIAQYDELERFGKISFLQEMADGRMAYEVMV